MISIGFSCENNESKKTLDQSALRNVLSKRIEYKEIINILTIDYVGLSSMNEAEKGKFFELAAKSREFNIDAMKEFGIMCEKFDFSARHLKIMTDLRTELRLNYVFDDADFDKIVEADYGKGIERMLLLVE